MEQYALYLLMKSKVNSIDSSFVCSFNDMDFNKPGVVGIYVRGGNVPRYRDIKTGNYFNTTARVQFVIQGDNSKDSLMNTMALASSLKDALITSSNLEYVVSNNQVRWKDGKVIWDPTGQLSGSDISVVLVRVSLMGEVNFIGKTKQGLPKYSVNFYVEYFCKEEKLNGL